MFCRIRADLQRHLRCDRRENDSLLWRLFIVFFAFGLHASTVYRFGNFLEQKVKPGLFVPLYFASYPVYLLLNMLVKVMYDISIDKGAVIGPGLYIGHFGGIEIEKCQIGKNCNIHQQVKIRCGCDIGDNVWIGAHAVLGKGVTVSNKATIMVGAQVISSVDGGCLVSGNPARIIRRNYDNRRLLGIEEL